MSRWKLNKTTLEKEPIAGCPTDSKNQITTFTSSDTTDANANSWTSVTKLESGEQHKSIFAKMSQMFKNIRYLYKMLGTTDISSIGNGTATGAISSLNTSLNHKIDLYGLSSTTSVWTGNVLNFVLTPNNGIMYHLIAMQAARTDTDQAILCEAWIIMRAQGATSPNVRNMGTSNISASWNANTNTLSITLPLNTYWLYRFSIEALHPNEKR